MNEFDRLKAQKDEIVRREAKKIFNEGFLAGVEAERERCAKIAEEGPWFVPVFDDEDIQKQWDESCDAFGRQIAVLIRDAAYTSPQNEGTAEVKP